MIPTHTKQYLVPNATDPGEYFMKDIRLEVVSEEVAVFTAQLCGPPGAPVWSRAWLANAVEEGGAETASDELKAGDTVRLELTLRSEMTPQLACIRIESAPLATQQVRCVDFGFPPRYLVKDLLFLMNSPEQMRSRLNAMTAEQQSQFSADWLAKLDAATETDPWVHGFRVLDRKTEEHVGDGCFKGPPKDGVVEMAYSVEPQFQGKGIGTQIAEVLTDFALGNDVPRVIAHTLHEKNASARILTKCGFESVGAVEDPEDGTVYRWERVRKGC